MRRQWTWLLPLRWRVFALLTVLAGLLIVDAVLAAGYYERLKGEQELSSELRSVEEVPEGLAAGLVDQQKSVRGFALTGDERLLDTYVRTQRVEGSSVTRLRRQLRGQPALQQLLDKVQAGATDWHQRVAEPVISATRAGRTREAAELVATLDEPLFNRLRGDVLALGQEMDEQLGASQRRAEAEAERLHRQLLASSILGLLFLGVSGALIRRWLTRPVGELSAQVRRVAAGRLHEAIAGGGPVELRRLGHDVDVMRRRILDELEASRRAVEGLQQNAPLVLSLRQELVTPGIKLPVGLRVAARFEPAEGVLAGDWIETIRLDKDRAGLIVVDVSGHGPEAGLRALWLKHLLVPALNLELAPADALHWVAGQIGDTDEWFATCVIVELNAATGRCVYANAGHPPALVLGPAGIRELPPTGPLFNDLPGARWDTTEVTLAEDELLVIYTDGITEARSENGEEFGEDRLAACLTSTSGFDVDTVADEIMDSVHAFGRGQLGDDATLVVATRQRVRTDLKPAAPAAEWAVREQHPG